MRTFSGIFASALAFIIVLSIIKTFNIALPISVTSRTVSGELSVVGEGKVDVAPDTANIQAGITAEGKTVREVENKINDVNNKIAAASVKLGIDKKDIKTDNYSINPSYEFTPEGRDNVSGYMGNASLTITVREQERVSQVITAATEAGANQVYNSGFFVDDPSKYREEARNKAIRNAKEQAQKLAKDLGIKLGRIVNIVETSAQNGPIPIYKDLQGLGGESAPNLQPGSQTITSVVTLYFEKR